MAEPFVPPPYPQDRLTALRRLADALPGGAVDVSVGNPVDAIPDAASAAFVAAAAANGYPPSIGTPELRTAASAYLGRRFGVQVDPGQVIATIGLKEFVASLPRFLSLRNPQRDTVLYPAISYPTYAMGAQLAGLRAVGVPLDDTWQLDLARVADEDAERALMVWVNEPSNPTASVADTARLDNYASWARARGIVCVNDECYAEFSAGADGRRVPPATVLASGPSGVLAAHSLSKRSNMAGLRCGFVAGDPELVGYLGEVRRHAGFMVPSPVQAAAAAALDDDDSLTGQWERFARRHERAVKALAEHGIVHDGGPMLFYLWLRTVDELDDGWELAARLAEAGTLVAPGDLYGPAGADHVRFSLAVADDRLDLALERLAQRSRS